MQAARATLEIFPSLARTPLGPALVPGVSTAYVTRMSRATNTTNNIGVGLKRVQRGDVCACQGRSEHLSVCEISDQ